MMKIFSALEGAWRFQRMIVNDGEMVGKACFTKKGVSQLRYREEGVWTRGDGTTFDVFRTYLFFLEGDKVKKYFDKKRLFYVLEGEGSEARGVYKCDRDIYEEIYGFAQGEFTLISAIKGPDKDVVIRTVFERVRES